MAGTVSPFLPSHETYRYKFGWPSEPGDQGASPGWQPQKLECQISAQAALCEILVTWYKSLVEHKDGTPWPPFPENTLIGLYILC